VQPGRLPREDIERSVGVALLVASLLAVVWMFVARASGSPAHAVLPVAGLVIGLAARLGARTCGPPVQRTAALSFAAFVAFGEVLLYRGALLPRLVALHRDEGASDAEVLAQQEFSGMEVSQYLHVELTLTLFLGVAAGLCLALWLTRSPVAVAAFRAPEDAVPESGSGLGPQIEPEAPAWP
jgi:hypothetical protein